MAEKKKPGMGRKILGAATAPLGGIGAMALLGPSEEASLADVAKYGAKTAYNAAIEDEEGMKAAERELDAAGKRKRSKERTRNSGSTTNAMGDTYKKGGAVKGYAKGGAVRGAGKAVKGVRKCKIC